MRIVIRPLAFLLILFLAAPAASADKGRFMVAAAHPLAAEAGREILAEGGSAVDAAIAVQMVLNLVEPQSSGIGGGTLMLHWHAATGKLIAYDGRETAPSYVRPDHFLDGNGEPLRFREAVLGGKSVGVPGAIAVLELAHREHGKLPWKRLFEPAIRRAKKGFEVSPRLAFMIATFIPEGPAGADTRAYFSDRDGHKLKVEDLLKNRPYAESLRRIADGGAAAFYSGPLAQEIVNRVRAAPAHPGPMTLDDLADYRAVKREPLCHPYRVWQVCGFPPPTSGGIAVLQILALLERFELDKLKPGSVEAVHLISEASRLAYADRNLYVADTDFITVPVTSLLATNYLTARSKLIDLGRSLGVASAGRPWTAQERAPDTSPEYPGTSHMTIVDADGNIVSMTTTIEFAFGSQLMAGGFLLNNELTDFAFRPFVDGRIVANAPQPGKRPRSSMAPMIVFDAQGAPVLAVGSAGGSRIPLDVAQTIIAVLDWNLTMQQAIALPHHANRNGPTLLEDGTALSGLKPQLERLGHTVRIGRTNSGLHGIRWTKDGLDGAADPRREGVVLAGRQ